MIALDAEVGQIGRASPPLGGGAEAVAEARAAVYLWLAEAWSGPPSRRAVVELGRERSGALLGEALGDERLEAALAELAETELPEQGALADEYHALLVVPSARYCMPFESVVLGGHKKADGRLVPGPLGGARSMAVKRAYAEAGYQLSTDFAQLPDHIGAELSFMARLCEDERLALAAGDRVAAVAAAAAQAAFLADHLGPFASALSERVEAEARLPFFRALAAFLRALVAAESGAAALP